MLQTEIRVDLPSELPAGPGRVRDLVGWLMGRAADPSEPLEQILVDGLTVFERVLRASKEAGFDDILSIVVDGKPAYVDVEHEIGDLDDALEGVVRRGALRDGFAVLRTTASRVVDGVRILAETLIRARVPEGRDESTIRVAGRVENLEIRAGEGPREYAARVRDWIREPGTREAASSTFQRVVAQLADGLVSALPGSRARVDPSRVRIVVPGPRQVARFRHLTFGSAIRPPVHQPLPVHERIGAYDDPFHRHIYSPYTELLSWILVGEVLDGRWPRSDVELVHPSGTTITTGDRAHELPAEALEVARHAVRVDERGDLVVDDAVPEVGTLDPAETGSPHSPGWGGEAWADDADGGAGPGEGSCSAAT